MGKFEMSRISYPALWPRLLTAVANVAFQNRCLFSRTQAVWKISWRCSLTGLAPACASAIGSEAKQVQKLLLFSKLELAAVGQNEAFAGHYLQASIASDAKTSISRQANLL